MTIEEMRKQSNRNKTKKTKKQKKQTESNSKPKSRRGAKKDQDKPKKLAYTPLTEAQKKLAREQLIRDLKSGKKGNYTSPGGSYFDDRLRPMGPQAKLPKKKKKK